MIAKQFDVVCSVRCECAVALAWLVAPERAADIIRALHQGPERPAEVLLTQLCSLEVEAARSLCQQTLRAVSYPLPESGVAGNA